MIICTVLRILHRTDSYGKINNLHAPLLHLRCLTPLEAVDERAFAKAIRGALAADEELEIAGQAMRSLRAC